MTKYILNEAVWAKCFRRVELRVCYWDILLESYNREIEKKNITINIEVNRSVNRLTPVQCSDERPIPCPDFCFL